MKTNQTKTSSSNTTQQAGKHSFFGKNDSALAEKAHFFGPRKEGNSFFNASSVQPKLTVGKPNDPYEREADAVADKVVQKMGEKTAVQKKEAAPSISALIQPKCNDCEKEEGIQKKEHIPEAPEKVSLKTLPENTQPLQTAEAVQPRLIQPKVIQSKIISPVPAVQAQCSDCGDEEKLQKKDEGPEGPEKLLRKAIFESNEDQPVQPKAQRGTAMRKAEPSAVTDIEEEKVQKKTEDALPEKIQQKPLPEITPVKLQTKPEPATLPIKQTTPAPVSVQTKCEACETEEKGKEEEGEGDVQAKIFKKPIFDTNSNTAALQPKASSVDRGPWTVDSSTRFIQRRCRECEEGSIVLRKAAHMIQREPVSGQSGTGTPEAVVEAAKGELGKVQARNDDGSGKRVGSDRLLEYFHVAAPGVWPDSIIETAGAEMPSWCGIFSVWAHKKAGKDVGNWEMGKGVSSSNSLTPTTNPQPGDIGYIDQPYQHHCIIEKVEGDNIHSIDGNSGLFSEVIRNIRPRSAYKNAFFTAFGGGGGSVQRKEEAEPVQAKGEESTAPSNVEQQLASSKGGGQSLPETTRSGMEQSMGADFSGVRIHTDSSAVQMNKDLHAQAFTHGSDIYFNSGKFDTGSSGGQHLLAHELTHVVQQGSAPAVQQKAEEETGKPPAVTEVPKEEEVINTLPEQSSGPAVQKQPATATPDGDASSAAQAVYDALDGWTSSGDSALILSKFSSRNKPTCDFMLGEVARLASQSLKAIFEWMLKDMVSSDWKAVRNHFISTKVKGVEVIIAYEVADRLDGYTSDDDSREIVNLFMGSSPLRGAQLSTVLAELQLKAGLDANGTAELLFGDMGLIDADKLCRHFFESGSVEARRYGSHWRAGKIRDLISGWTGADDSHMIVVNFERTPPSGREDILADLEVMCQQEWSNPASKELMENMWQSDYEKLQKMLPGLPVWNVERNLLESIGVGVSVLFDYVGALLQYGVCGLVGVVWGILLIVKDIVVMVWDLLVGVYNFLGWVLHQISSNLAREEAESFEGFFTGIGKFFDAPWDAISMMWGDLVLESKLIEGPFRECRQAVFWMSRLANLLVNLLLIIAGGYGAVKLAVQGLQALINLVRAGELMAALGRLPQRLWGAVKKLPAAAGKALIGGTGKVMKLILNPAETLNGVWGKIGKIRRAAAEQGYMSFLRQQAGKAVQDEGEFWRKWKEGWKLKAEAADAKANEAEAKLVQAVENSVDDPLTAEATVAKAEQEAQAANKEVDDVINEITGDGPATEPAKPATPAAPQSFDSRLPEAWRAGAPARPGMLDTAVGRLKNLKISEDTIVAIIRNLANTKDDGYMFFADLNRFAKFGEEGKFGKPVLDAVVNGMASEKNFSTGRILMEKISNNPKGNIDALVRTFSMEDIGSLRTRFPAKKNSDFLTDLDTIGARVNARPEEVMALFNEAGEGEAAMDNIIEALDRLGEGPQTLEKVRESLNFGKRVAEAMAKGGEDLAKAIWQDAYLGRDPETGMFKVSANLTKNKDGDLASAFIRTRSQAITTQLLGGEGGTGISAENWAKVREVLANTDLPQIVRNDIVGQSWAAAKRQAYTNMGWEVIGEVSINILGPDGKPTGKKSIIDAVLRSKDGKEIKYKEFKSSQKADTTNRQKEVYPLIEKGDLGQLKPSGENAEKAFGGADMPDFRPGPVDIERPPTL